MYEFEPRLSYSGMAMADLEMVLATRGPSKQGRRRTSWMPLLGDDVQCSNVSWKPSGENQPIIRYGKGSREIEYLRYD